MSIRLGELRVADSRYSDGTNQRCASSLPSVRFAERQAATIACHVFTNPTPKAIPCLFSDR